MGADFRDVFEARAEPWAVLRVKKLNLLPAKFRFDMDTWPGDENGAHRVITAMAEVGIVLSLGGS